MSRARYRWTAAGLVLWVTSTLTLNAQTPRAAMEQQRALRHQISTMEAVLERAVEHGAGVTRDRLRAVMPPTDVLLSERARVRGFKIEGYGVFFDVEVPSLEETLPWSFRMLDRMDLGLDSALRRLREVVDRLGDVDAQQALKRVELQVMPAPIPGAQRSAPEVAGATTDGARFQTGSPASTTVSPASTLASPQVPDPILNDPVQAFREEIVAALMDAMLDHSRGVEIGAEEWLHIGARRNNDRPAVLPADGDAPTVQIRARGRDLTDFLAGQIGREEARKRMQVKVF
jgi:hypothetical protein